MPDLSHLSDAKRILLEKYLSGNAASARKGKPQITLAREEIRRLCRWRKSKFGYTARWLRREFPFTTKL